jgi:hypothetical protein
MAAPILRRITHLIMISRKRTLLRQRVNHRVVRVRCRLHAELTTLYRALDIAGAWDGLPMSRGSWGR